MILGEPFILHIFLTYFKNCAFHSNLRLLETGRRQMVNMSLGLDSAQLLKSIRLQENSMTREWKKFWLIEVYITLMILLVTNCIYVNVYQSYSKFFSYFLSGKCSCYITYSRLKKRRNVYSVTLSKCKCFRL